VKARLRRRSHERLKVFLAIEALGISLAIDHALYIYIHALDKVLISSWRDKKKKSKEKAPTRKIT
jgi:hypothetical protein